MTLSEQLTTAREAKKAKQAERAANRKPTARKPMRMPVQQNKLLLLKDPQRFTEQEKMDSQIKVHLYLALLLQEHDLHYVRYFSLLLVTIRAMCLIQNRPLRLELVEKAEQELATSQSRSVNRQSHFVALTALANAYADDMESSSKTFMLECNDHAIAVATMDVIADMLALPSWTFPAFGELCAMVSNSVHKLAGKYEVSEYAMRNAIMTLAHALYVLYYCDYWGRVVEPKSIPQLRMQSAYFMAFMAEVKSTARHQTGKIREFSQLFGVALIDLNKLAMSV